MQLLPAKSGRLVLAVLAFLSFFFALPYTAEAQTVPVVSVSGGSATEGRLGDLHGVTVGRERADGGGQYATSSGTATSGTDFTAKSGTLAFPPGVTSGTVSVQTTEDTDDEEDETFTLTLSSPTNATLGTNTTATGTINEPDEASLPLVSVSGGNSATEGNAVEFTVRLSKASESQVSVNFTPHQASGDTATRDDDFSWLSGVVLMGPGVTSSTIRVTTTDDALDEENETFTVTLTGALNATLGANKSARGTINDNDSLPAVSVSNASATEGGSVSFAVSLSTASGRQVTVDYATSSSTATSGTDFTAASGKLTFAAGTTSKTVSVSTTEDTDTEGNETFTLTLSSATNATLGDATATGTINDAAGQSALNVSGGSADEGDAVNFTVSLSVASGQTVTVDYATSSGTATSGTDFTAKSGTLTFAANETSKTVSVSTADDSTDEQDETFTLTLSSPTNATLALNNATATGTINDDDGLPVLSPSDASADEGEVVRFTVSLSPASGKQVTVQYATSSGTATSGTDFTASSGTLTFAAGTTSQRVSVSTTADTTDEEDETFTLTLSSPANATLGTAAATGTINDNDSPPALSVSNASATEGASVTFGVALSVASGRQVTVDYATSSGTATSGTDFTASSGTLTFASGTRTQTVSVSTTEDTDGEEDETFTLTLSSATNATLGDATATGTINDDDGLPAVSVSGGSATEGASVTFTVSLSVESEQTVAVQYATSSGTATSGTDFTAKSGTLAFPPGVTSGTVSVQTTEDTDDEEDETFTLTLSNPTNATLGTNTTATGTINEPEEASLPLVSVSGGNSATEGNAVEFTVRLSKASESQVSVNFTPHQASGDTATRDDDFSWLSGVHLMAAGETSGTIRITTTDDALDEEDETFTLSLTGATNAALGANVSARGTINDNDSLPAVSVSNASTTEGGSVSFTVSLSPASGRQVTVDYATSSSTATSGTDFTAASGTLTFASGTRTQTVSVSTTEDTDTEGNETFTLTLSSATNATLGAATATGTINDDDGTSTLSVSGGSADEGDAVTFTVSLSPASGRQVTVDYATSSGTATSGTDFTAAPGTLTFAANETSKTVSVRTTEDLIKEEDETFTLTLSSPTNATLGDATATGTISDDDERPTVLDFAHFANGNGIISDLVFVNVAPHPIRPALYFYDKEGHLITPESVMDLTGDLEVREDGSLSILKEMEPVAELTISTHGRGDLVTGSVKVVSDGPIGGVLRFDLPDIGVAGVGVGHPTGDALFPARRQAEGISTAAAIHNLEEEAIIVTCRLMKEGLVLEEEEILLAAYGQEAQFIEEMFTTTDTSNFVGLVRYTGPGRFTGVAVELDAASRIFTTLPVVPVNLRGRGREAVLDFAHFANGEGITSDLVFANVETQPSGPAPTPFHTAIPPIRPALYFYDKGGNPIAAESVVEITGDLEVRADGGLSVRTEMEPLGELTISTHGQGEVVSGSVRVVSNGPIGGVLRFDLPGIGVAGVGASPPVRDAIFPARREVGGISTAAAVHNIEEEAIVVSCRLMSGGVVLEEMEISLAAYGQEAQFIEEMFTTTDTSNFVGLVRCTGPGRFTGVAVELDAASRIFTTLPVVPVPERMSQE